jgi:hypothetical protein
MNNFLSLQELSSIIQNDFLDIVQDITFPTENKLRIILIDKSFVDIFLSEKLLNGFSFHWERNYKNNTICRYDNYPDPKWKKVKTFPYHFHFQKENKVIASPFAKTLPNSFIDFMEFVRKEINKS